jgi:hypothetical protein
MSTTEPLDADTDAESLHDQSTTDLGDDESGAALAMLVAERADDVRMNEFREPSGAAHGHSPAKGEGVHDIRGRFNVSETFIRAHFPSEVLPNGHEAVHCLLAGKTAFIAADEDIFTDTVDEDSGRWEAIRNIATQAPIPPGRRSELDALFD